MQKSSKIVLAVSGLLLALLVFLYFASQQKPPDMNVARMTAMLDTMKDAVAHKDARKIMSYVDPSSETRVSKLNVDQLSLVISRALRESTALNAQYSGLTMRKDGVETIAEFDLRVNQHLNEGDADDYRGHITLHMREVEVPHLLGLYHTAEWRIVRADTNGPDLSNYGDY